MVEISPRRWNERAEEDILRPIVWIVSFVSVTALLTGLVSQFYDQALFGGQADYSTGYNTIGGMTYDMLTPYEGVTLTSDDVVDMVDADSAKSFYFNEGESDDIQCLLVRDNFAYAPWTGLTNCMFEDFLWFKMHYGWFSVVITVLPFETIVNNYQWNSNCSVNDVKIGHRSYTVFVQTTGEVAFETGLYANNFNVSMGVDLETALASNSLWSTLGQILTLQLPDTHWIINLLLAVPIWTAIGVLAFLVIRSLVPW